MVTAKHGGRVGAVGAALVLLLGACGAQAEVPDSLKAGAGKSVIALPKDLLPIEGFGVEHDPLTARVLVLDNGSARLAIAVVDQTSIFEGLVNELRDIIARVDSVPAGNVWIVASHTFSAPHVSVPRPEQAATPEGQALARKGDAYREAVVGAVTRAAQAAAQDLRPARVAFGAGVSSVNVNRNMMTADGWWLGADDAGPSDKSVGVLRVEDAQRKPIAVLVNYAVQSAVMNQSVVKDGLKAVTADLAGAAVRHVEDQYGDGAVSMFLTGASGDQSPTYLAQRNVLDKDGHVKTVDLGAAAYPLVDLLGERLGAEAVRVSQALAAGRSAVVLKAVAGSVDLDAQERPQTLAQIRPSRTYAYKINGKRTAPYFVMQIGDTALVGVQVELSALTGQAIKQRSPFKNTLVVTMVNGAAKYLPDAASYKRITYPSMNSSYGPGGAEILQGKILETLAVLHKTTGK